MKLLRAFPAALAFAITPHATAQDGILDPTFGDRGQVIHDIIPAGGERVLDIANGVGGRLLAIVSEDSGGSDRAFLVSLLPNGALDTSFGVGGIRALAQTGGGCDAAAFDVNGDSFACVGNLGGNVFVQRFLVDGSLDPAYAGLPGGRIVDFGGGDDGNAVTFQRDGKIVVVGDTYSPVTQKSDFAIARIGLDGLLDATFSCDGKQTVTFDLSGGAFEEAFAVRQAPGLAVTGDIYVAGTADYGTGTDTDFAVARLNPDGLLDTGFSNDGKYTRGVDRGGSNADRLAAIGISFGGNRIVLAGTAEDATDNPMIQTQAAALIVVTNAGVADPDFAGAGCANPVGCTIIDYPNVFPRRETLGELVTVAFDGSVVLAGRANGYSMFKVRFAPTGAIDPTFNDAAVVNPISPGIAIGGPDSMHIDPAGRRIFGYSISANPEASVFARIDDNRSVYFRNSFE